MRGRSVGRAAWSARGWRRHRWPWPRRRRRARRPGARTSSGSSPPRGEGSQVMEHLDVLCNRIGPRLTGSDNLTNACEWAARAIRRVRARQRPPRALGRVPRRVQPRAVVRPRRRARGAGARVRHQCVVGRHQGRRPRQGCPRPQGPEGARRGQGQGHARRRLGRHAPAAAAGHGRVRRTGAAPPAKKAEAPKAETPRPRPPRRPARGPIRPSSARSARSWRPPRSPDRQRLATRPAPDRAATTGSPGTSCRPCPSVTLLRTQYDEIVGWLKAGKPVTLEFDIRNYFKKGPITLYNVIADIPGSEKPDEYVIVGGHLDSWDGATGATDNGTGVCHDPRGGPHPHEVGREAQADDPVHALERRGTRAARLGGLRQGPPAPDAQDLGRAGARRRDQLPLGHRRDRGDADRHGAGLRPGQGARPGVSVRGPEGRAA